MSALPIPAQSQELPAVRAPAPSQAVAGEVVVLDQPAFSAEALIAQAVSQGLALDTLERLLALRDRLKAERAREAFFAALSAFQGECPVIPKGRAVMQRDGRSERYRYASLGDIVQVVAPLLHKHGLSYRLRTQLEVGTPSYMLASCTVHHAGGHAETSEFRVPLSSDGFMNAAQHHGSARTYATRYAFTDALGIMTGDEDDDAGSLNGSGPPSPAQPAEAAKRPEPPLTERLRIFEQRLVSEGLCRDGELLAYVRKQMRDKGYGESPSGWTGELQTLVGKCAKAFEGFKRQKTAGPREPTAQDDGEHLATWLEHLDRQLAARGQAKPGALLEYLRVEGRRVGLFGDFVTWEPADIPDAVIQAKKFVERSASAAKAAQAPTPLPTPP